MAHHAEHTSTHSRAEHGGGQSHGSTKLYWIFAVILCVFTFCEWLIFDKRLDWNITNNILVPSLLFLSLVKFVMVVGWYMHLRYDPGWMKKVFLVSLVMGGGISIVLHVLMS
jgi:cytochrome c oxidase subunit 4